MGHSSSENQREKHGRHRITATSTDPGTAKDQGAYRIDITGPFHMNSIIKTICEKHNIKSGGIMDAYSGLNETKKSMEANTTYLCHPNHFDIVSAIDKKLTKSPLTWSWQHVKGNQYEKCEYLDRWETPNVECKHKDKLKRKEDQLSR